ncbi:galactose mutarotase-like domain-containing protein [Naematelia encephala]|uniref:Glucose-6-phosphate 1-epimerase n=1 Tax=Naematelia encephala TaxID=71784 RepID=A0A1Y2AJ90_9TREE|nr:galactose mutarotase-like domain-containing protein [Naematelia encephala]
MGVEQNGKTIVLKLASGASAEIYLFGATVTSWIVDGKERMFLSSKSSLDSTKAIRGGIPIVFPIFGPPPSSPPEYAALKQHGFVRTQDWTLDSIIMDRDEGVSVRLTSPPPPSEFNHKFTLSYVVTLTKHQLSTDVHINNTGNEDFIFQVLLHNYLAVPDVKKITITGLDKGIEFFDKAAGGKMGTWQGGELKITQETDRVMWKVPSQEIKVDDGEGSGFLVKFRGFEDCTIWNPQEKSGKNMADMEENGWDRYICIEPGYVREFKSIKAGEEFLGQQVLTVL